MKILFDYQIFSIQRYGGATRYFCELLKNIPAEHQFNLALLFSDNYYLKENYDFFKKPNILPDKNFTGKYHIQKQIISLNKYYSKRCISSNNFDLFHPTYYDNYFIKLVKKPYVITVHDLIVFKFKDTLYKSHEGKLPIENAIKNATRLIAISENTKKDLTEIFNINPGKIDVIYHGYNPSNSIKRDNMYGKYILFVGRRSSHKNFAIFAKSIGNLLNREREIKLLCVGPAFSKEEIAILSGLGISKQALAINVADDALNDLYANALVFVYPSLYEGFGMPILEAFANDCPVCLSNTSCFPEIAGNAGAYFDPCDQASILHAIEKVIYDTDYATEIKKAGKRRLVEFSWEKAARETIFSYVKTIG